MRDHGAVARTKTGRPRQIELGSRHRVSPPRQRLRPQASPARDLQHAPGRAHLRGQPRDTRTSRRNVAVRRHVILARPATVVINLISQNLVGHPNIITQRCRPGIRHRHRPRRRDDPTVHRLPRSAARPALLTELPQHQIVGGARASLHAQTDSAANHCAQNVPTLMPRLAEPPDRSHPRCQTRCSVTSATPSYRWRFPDVVGGWARRNETPRPSGHEDRGTRIPWCLRRSGRCRRLA